MQMARVGRVHSIIRLTIPIVCVAMIFMVAYTIYRKQQKQISTEHFADLGNVLYMNQSMDAFDALTSPNILYKLVYQNDGNLSIVKVSTGKEIWTTGVKEKDVKPGKAVMAHDGNLILYDANSKIYWTTGTNNKSEGPFRLELQNDGTIAIFDAKNATVWTTKENLKE